MHISFSYLFGNEIHIGFLILFFTPNTLSKVHEIFRVKKYLGNLRCADTVGNGVFDQRCVFPFTCCSEDTVYQSCTTRGESFLWCSLETDENNEHLGGRWGTCAPEGEGACLETVLSLAIGSSISGEADIGDSYEFSLRLDMPQASDAASLSVLVSGTNSDTQTASIKLCSPSLKTVVKYICYIKKYIPIITTL